MRKESLNIAVACFIGGMLGVLFAVKIAEMYEFGRYFWFVGAFAGGAIAYLAYDPIAFASVTRRAWYELADVKRAKRFLRTAAATVEVVSLIAVIIAGLIIIFYGGLIGYDMLGLWGKGAAVIWMVSMCVMSICFEVAVLFHFPRFILLLTPEGPRRFRRGLRVIALALNPIVFPLVIAAATLFCLWLIARQIARHLALCAWRAPKAAWLLAVFTARFVRLVFVYIHSTARVVCFVDTALGVAVAYTLVSETLGAMLAGGAFGLVFGVLNYELISVRLLNLVPARVNARK